MFFVGTSIVRPPPQNLSAISSMFANGEDGVWLDPSDTATLYQSNLASITSSSQSASLVLDKHKAPTVVSQLPAMTCSATVSQSGNVLTFNNSAAGDQASGGGIRASTAYKISFTVSGAGSVIVYVGGVPFVFSPGAYVLSFYYTYASTFFIFRAHTGGFNGEVKFVEYVEYTGNHAIQPSGTKIPLFQGSPSRLVFDGVDDQHDITFTSALGSNCTIARAVPGNGAVILTGQTIGTTYSVTSSHAGLLIINRALTSAETAYVTALFNARA